MSDPIKVQELAAVIATAIDHCRVHNVSCGEPSEYIARAVLSSDPVKELVEALQELTGAVGNMRVPQDVPDAALQVRVTLGPAYEHALAVLNRFKGGA